MGDDCGFFVTVLLFYIWRTNIYMRKVNALHLTYIVGLTERISEIEESRK